MLPITLNIYVKHQEHCNLDSFPLRFGFSFQEDQFIKVIRTSSGEPTKHHSDRRTFKGTMINPETNAIESATFVVIKSGSDKFKMVTAWRNDQKTEYYLSEVMKSLRLSGALTVKELLSFHQRYIKGELCEHADLVLALSENKTSSELARIKQESEQAVDKVTKELEALKNENSSLKKENSTLQQLLNQERARANETNSHMNVSDANTLIRVETNVIYRNSSCTVLTLGDGQKWYMKTSTFDRTGQVTRQAQSLLNKEVVITSWDPMNAPGKWSSQGYFRNVYAA